MAPENPQVSMTLPHIMRCQRRGAWRRTGGRTARAACADTPRPRCASCARTPGSAPCRRAKARRSPCRDGPRTRTAHPAGSDGRGCGRRVLLFSSSMLATSARRPSSRSQLISRSKSTSSRALARCPVSSKRDRLQRERAALARRAAQKIVEGGQRPWCSPRSNRARTWRGLPTSNRPSSRARLEADRAIVGGKRVVEQPSYTCSTMPRL